MCVGGGYVTYMGGSMCFIYTYVRARSKYPHAHTSHHTHASLSFSLSLSLSLTHTHTHTSHTPHPPPPQHQEGMSSFKAQREAQRKADAGNKTAWNSLFMRPDTVAEAVAAHFGMSKSELLERHAGDLPLRMALGETHVIAATKKDLGDAGVLGGWGGGEVCTWGWMWVYMGVWGCDYTCTSILAKFLLHTHTTHTPHTTHTHTGVNVAALESAAAAAGSGSTKHTTTKNTTTTTHASIQRSTTTLLLKNLPYTTTREELEELCGRAGQLARLVLPSTHTLALVEYLEPQDARTYVMGLGWLVFVCWVFLVGVGVVSVFSVLFVLSAIIMLLYTLTYFPNTHPHTHPSPQQGI